jgi:hypothetical protein
MAAPLVGGPPGVELHTVVDGLPSGDTGDVVPVALPTNGEAMVPNTVPGIIAAVLAAMGAEIVAGTVVDGAGTDATVATGGGAAGEDDAVGTVEPGKSVINEVAGVADSGSGAVELAAVGVGEVAGTVGVVGAANVEGVVPIVPPTADMEVTGTVGVPGAICPVGVEQVTTVPGVVGSEASGTGASVVSAVPGWVVAENGLGPLSGDVTIVPGVDARPIAVEPMVETCARPAWQPASRMTVVNSRRRIDIPPSVPV